MKNQYEPRLVGMSEEIEELIRTENKTHVSVVNLVLRIYLN